MVDVAVNNWLATKVRRTLQTWLAVYPCVVLFLALVGDQFHHLSMPLRVLVSTAVIVPVVVFIAGPMVERLLDAASAFWGRRKAKPSADDSGEEGQ